MQAERVCKTVRQYSKDPIPKDSMDKLCEIAKDYNKVKNYVYQRYGGIGSLGKLYPGYTVQNEMTDSGLRDELGLPAVYFYLAVFDALGDIKCQWTQAKTKILAHIAKREDLNDREKHYLRFVLKGTAVLEAILCHTTVKLPEAMQKQYEKLAEDIDTQRLDKYIRRQVRRNLVRPHTDKAEGFSIAERAYRYGDGGIYISIKEKRKRVFISLTDSHQYKRQLSIQLYPEQGKLEIKVPVDVRVRRNRDYIAEIGIAVGVRTMLTTDSGHVYGERLGEYQRTYSDWVRIQTGKYNSNRETEPGRKKYQAKKHRMEEQFHSYINQELNCFLRQEKPRVIYLAKLPKAKVSGSVKQVNFFMTMWQRGYIRKRLIQKCREQSVTIIEVFGKDISIDCSNCGAVGQKENGMFLCPACGYMAEEKMNTARNVKNRGVSGKEI